MNVKSCASTRKYLNIPANFQSNHSKTKNDITSRNKNKVFDNTCSIKGKSTTMALLAKLARCLAS